MFFTNSEIQLNGEINRLKIYKKNKNIYLKMYFANEINKMYIIQHKNYNKNLIIKIVFCI